MKDDFYEKLCQRLVMPDGDLLTYDEVMQWPEGKLDELVGQGKVCPAGNSETVVCTECPEGCVIAPDMRKHPETDELLGVYVCPEDADIGRITVDLNRLQQWKIVTTKPKTRKRRKKKVAVKKMKVATSFKRWDNEEKACFAYQSGTVHFCYRKECKKIPFKKDSQAPLVIAAFLKGPIAGKRIKELAQSNSEPSQIVRNLNRTINTQLRKIGFTDIQKVGFIYYDDGANKYRLSPDIVEYAIYLAHHKENG